MVFWVALEPVSLKISNRTTFRRLSGLIPKANIALASGCTQIITNFMGGEVHDDYVKFKVKDEIIFFAKTGHILAYKEGAVELGDMFNVPRNTIMRFPILDVFLPYKVLDYGKDMESLKQCKLFS